MQSTTYPVLSMYENTNHDYLTTQICLSNSTDTIVAFKVKTNSPDRMFISPTPMVILEPQSKLDLNIRAPTTFFTVDTNINVLIQSGYIYEDNPEIINGNKFWDPSCNSEISNTFLRIRPSHNESHCVEVGCTQDNTTSSPLTSAMEDSIHDGEEKVGNQFLMPVVVDEVDKIKVTKDVFSLEKCNSQRPLEAGDAPKHSQSKNMTKYHASYSESITWSSDSTMSKSDVIDQSKMTIYDGTQCEVEEECEQLQQVPKEGKAVDEEGKAVKEQVKAVKEEGETVNEEGKAVREEEKAVREEGKAIKEEAKAKMNQQLNPCRDVWSTIKNELTIIMNDEKMTTLKWPILYIVVGLLLGWLFI